MGSKPQISVLLQYFWYFPFSRNLSYLFSATLNVSGYFAHRGCIVSIDLSAATHSVRHDYRFQVHMKRGATRRFVQSLGCSCCWTRRPGCVSTGCCRHRSPWIGRGRPDQRAAVCGGDGATGRRHAPQAAGSRRSDSVLTVSVDADVRYGILRTPRMHRQ